MRRLIRNINWNCSEGLNSSESSRYSNLPSFISAIYSYKQDPSATTCE